MVWVSGTLLLMMNGVGIWDIVAMMNGVGIWDIVAYDEWCGYLGHCCL